VLLDERDGDIEGKARDGDARLCGEIPLSLARTRHDAARRLGDHRGGCRVHLARRRACPARVAVRAAPEI
jgi:predicted RecB family endonuclease